MESKAKDGGVASKGKGGAGRKDKEKGGTRDDVGGTGSGRNVGSIGLFFRSVVEVAAQVKTEKTATSQNRSVCEGSRSDAAGRSRSRNGEDRLTSVSRFS